MRDLGGDMVVAVWEAAREQHPLERALTLLTLARPEDSRDELARLSIGDRDRLLLGLRAQLFGSRLCLEAVCPACREGNEFELAMQDVLHPPVSGELGFASERGRIRFRLPDSFDLARSLACDDPQLARETLAQRCLVDDVPIDAALLDQLAAAIELHDPQCEVRFAITCSACSHAWKPIFDAGELLYSELATVARELLSQVHALAHAYKWREAEILAMSGTRRRFYLQMVGYE
jgi:hypothetical protein